MALARWSRPQVKREPSADDVYWRMLEDRRGTVVREGVTYKGDGEVVSWCVRYSVGGRVDQFDMVVNGRVWRRGGARKVREWMGVRV